MPRNDFSSRSRVRSGPRGRLRRVRCLTILKSAALGGASLVALAASPAAAQPLLVDDVLRGVEATHPELDAATLKVDGAVAKGLAADGGFDPKLSVKARSVQSGYYKSDQVDALIRQNTPVRGLDLFAGYRLGSGDFAVYKGEQETRSQGEVRAGAELPLWKDAAIDERRAKRQEAIWVGEEAQCALQATRLELREAAAIAYWDWVASGQGLKIAESLLGVAQERDTALRAQAALGSIAPLSVTDNERMVLERRSRRLSANLKLEQAAIKLSMYLRKEDGTPFVVSSERLPERIAPLQMAELPTEEADVALSLTQQPELCKLEAALRSQRVVARLADNQVAPKLNALVYASKDLGAGAYELAPTELTIGVDFELPLGLRKARGEADQAQAETGALSAKLRWSRDKVQAEVKRARASLRAASEQLVLVREQVRVAADLAQAERERFAQGASDLMLVNLRELAAAEAARLEVEALAAQHVAWIEYRTATASGL